METLVNPSPEFWSGKRVLVTGHTGFKGAWLSMWLERLGAIPLGLSLPPETIPNLSNLLDFDTRFSSIVGDIRDGDLVRKAVEDLQPEIILHLAAQTLVRRSYAEPTMTFETNVMGTINVLEAARQTNSVRAILVITSDKCYENREWHWPYREDEAMGGHDPYSASKGCTELVTSAWRRSFFDSKDVPSVAIASVRAGNVIGGGDWAEDRLIPDCIRAIEAGRPVNIRNPHATRPWQFVLEPLSGYLRLVEKMYEDTKAFSEGWNFGPVVEDAKPVSYVVDKMTQLWGDGASWEGHDGLHPHEASFLAVDASKARARLNWRPRLRLDDALAWTTNWYKRKFEGESVATLVAEQIETYETFESAE